MNEEIINNISSLSYDAYNYEEISKVNLNDSFFIEKLYKHIDNIMQDIKGRIQVDIATFSKQGYDIPEGLWLYLEPSLDENIKGLKKSLAYLSHISDITSKLGLFQANLFYEQINKQINNQMYAIYWDINNRLKLI